MRVPGSWNDKSVLQDEPLRSNFEKAPKQRKFVGRANLVKIIRKRKKDGGDVVYGWIRQCLKLPHHRKVSKKNFQSTEERDPFWDFVDFYWSLYIGDDEAANKVLTRTLSRRGFALNDPKTLKSLGDSTTTSSSHSEPSNLGKSRQSFQHDSITRVKSEQSQVVCQIGAHTEQLVDTSHRRKRGLEHVHGSEVPSAPGQPTSSALQRPPAPLLNLAVDPRKSSKTSDPKFCLKNLDKKMVLAKQDNSSKSIYATLRFTKTKNKASEPSVSVPPNPVDLDATPRDSTTTTTEHNERNVFVPQNGPKFEDTTSLVQELPLAAETLEPSSSDQADATQSISALCSTTCPDVVDTKGDHTCVNVCSEKPLSDHHATTQDLYQSSLLPSINQLQAKGDIDMVDVPSVSSAVSKKRSSPELNSSLKRRRLESALEVKRLLSGDEFMTNPSTATCPLVQVEASGRTLRTGQKRNMTKNTAHRRHTGTARKQTTAAPGLSTVPIPSNGDIPDSTSLSSNQGMEAGGGKHELLPVSTRNSKKTLTTSKKQTDKSKKRVQKTKAHVGDSVVLPDVIEHPLDSKVQIKGDCPDTLVFQGHESVQMIEQHNTVAEVKTFVVPVMLQLLDNGCIDQLSMALSNEAAVMNVEPMPEEGHHPPFQDSASLPLLKQEPDEFADTKLISDMELPNKVEDSLYRLPLDDQLDHERLCYLPKPELPSLPPIWAESRQEICESFDWFRSYQGGVYHANNAVKGYLLGGFPSSRDIFEHGGRFIISHGGGKAESLHTKHGQISCQLASDQMAQDKSVRALYDNYVHNRPLVLVTDDNYALFPYDLRSKNVTYAVLGLYTIVYAWAEYQPANNALGRVVRYKFAFRWCDHQGDPWWHFDRAEAHNSPTSIEARQGVDQCIPSKTQEVFIPQPGQR
ncbi:hypothetical protein D9613_000489 [Agrocybe pediades]|uniref:Uncharacterized protein n=1 Tax=Agrocybe pediades TaxID=84607 RepID=A0A8H4R0W5_9AGAR|nr:hypothetical protein D9613_000489 [Agrocybe pediades]